MSFDTAQISPVYYDDIILLVGMVLNAMVLITAGRKADRLDAR